MNDPVIADLNRYLSDQERGERFMEKAQDQRDELVEDFIADDKNRDILSELFGEVSQDPEALTCLQRICSASEGKVNDMVIVVAAVRLATLFRQRVDKSYGDELVEKQAEREAEYRPCKCRDFCTC